MEIFASYKNLNCKAGGRSGFSFENVDVKKISTAENDFWFWHNKEAVYSS